jgi:tetratricopeptide (TPR) repeat protein
VFAVQEEIARHVADSLVSTVGVRPTIARVSRTEHPEAYAAYLAGRYLLYRRTREGMRGALEEFQKAIALDSAYAPAYAGLALVYIHWAFYNYSGIDPYEGAGRALVLANRAVALDSDLAEGYVARGLALTWIWAPAAGIEQNFKRALELQPNSAEMHQWYAVFLSREGRYEETLAEAERAIALDPLAPGAHIGFSLEALVARRYDVAVREAERTVALEPSLMWARAVQGLSYLLSGNLDHCATLSLGPYAAVRAMCLHSLGRLQEATRIADSLRVAFMAGTSGDSIYGRAIAARGVAEYYAWTGNAEESIAWLQRAYAISPQGEDVRLITSGIYDKARNDPRFKAGLQQIYPQAYDRARRASLGVGLKGAHAPSASP